MSEISIRNATLADAPRILEIYAYYVERTVITFEYTVPSLAEFEGRMRRTMEKYPYLVIEKDGRIEGYAYAGPFVGRAAYDWACELTIYLDHNAQKCGMGKMLYNALADRLKDMSTSGLPCAAPSKTAATSSAGGTTWSGWKRSSASTFPTSLQSRRTGIEQSFHCQARRFFFYRINATALFLHKLSLWFFL